MAFLLPALRYSDIRIALDPTLGDEAIPDEIIESDLILGRAERWAKAQDTAWETRSGEELKALYRAITYYTAALLSPGLPQTKQENMAGHTATMAFAETPAERTERLALMAQVEIDSYVSPTTEIVLVGAPVFVTTVQGRRA